MLPLDHGLSPIWHKAQGRRLRQIVISKAADAFWKVHYSFTPSSRERISQAEDRRARHHLQLRILAFRASRRLQKK